MPVVTVVNLYADLCPIQRVVNLHADLRAIHRVTNLSLICTALGSNLIDSPVLRVFDLVSSLDYLSQAIRELRAHW